MATSPEQKPNTLEADLDVYYDGERLMFSLYSQPTYNHQINLCSNLPRSAGFFLTGSFTNDWTPDFTILRIRLYEDNEMPRTVEYQVFLKEECALPFVAGFVIQQACMCCPMIYNSINFEPQATNSPNVETR